MISVDLDYEYNKEVKAKLSSWGKALAFYVV